jgi:hypothetical protein
LNHIVRYIEFKIVSKKIVFQLFQEGFVFSAC